MIKKLYVNNKLAAIDVYTIEEREEPAKFNIKLVQSDLTVFDITDECDFKFYSNMREYLPNIHTNQTLQTFTKETHYDVWQPSNSLHDFVDKMNEKYLDKHYAIVYGYNHSGICLSLTPFSCKWDSGIAGVIEMNKDDAEYQPDMFIEIINADLSGEIYDVIVYDELNNYVDVQVSGIFGNNEQLQEQMRMYISEQYNITDEQIEQAVRERFD